MNKQSKILAGLTLAMGLGISWPATATLIEAEDTVSGLSASADFSFSGSTLTIVLTNTSTGVPAGFSNSDQLLTSVAFGLPNMITITGGSAAITTGSESVNFDVMSQLSGGDDVSPEWGFGNGGGTGFGDLVNFVTANASGATKFAIGNLDGPDALDGPQGGLTNGIVDLGGLGAIDNSATFTLVLSSTLMNLDFLTEGVTFEFGSDAAFLTVENGTTIIDTPVPEPGILGLLGIGLLGMGLVRRRRYFH